MIGQTKNVILKLMEYMAGWVMEGGAPGQTMKENEDEHTQIWISLHSKTPPSDVKSTAICANQWLNLVLNCYFSRNTVECVCRRYCTYSGWQKKSRWCLD